LQEARDRDPRPFGDDGRDVLLVHLLLQELRPALRGAQPLLLALQFLLQAGDHAVAQLGGPAQVPLALGPLLFQAGGLDPLLQPTDALDHALLALPALAQARRLALQGPQAVLQSQQPFRGLRVLLAPPSPEMAELITPAGFRRALEVLRSYNDLVVVDCASWFSDVTIGTLDVADIVLTVLSLEITSIKNMRLFLEVAGQLGYEQDKMVLVLNRADAALGIRIQDVEQSIGRKVDHQIVSDGRSVVFAVNRGVPFYLSNRDAQVSQDILRLAKAIVGDYAATSAPADAKATQKKSLFAWRS